MRIAIVGSGISGLMAAHVLSRVHDVSVFEAADRVGGHTNTVQFHLDGVDHAVDTGFIVYNERNYPTFTRLLGELNVATQPSEMSFSVRDDTRSVEWAGTSLSGIFAHRRNVASPRFLIMLGDIARFSRIARRELARPSDPTITLEHVLSQHRWSRDFRDLYLVPLGAAIWSANPTTFTQFPADTFMRFCDNHGLLTYRNRPAWRTVTGGAANYVRALSAPIADKIHRSSPVSSISRGDNCARLAVGGATLDFDHVIIACHSDQALAMLSDPSDLETASLRAIRYQPNTATLHTDRSLLPQSNRAQASWNYHVRGPNAFEAVLTYNMNRLQNIQSQTPILVTLNGRDLIASETVIAEFTYEHPIFDAAAVVAQGRHRDICTSLTSFCGAYWGYGFHEDGAVSGLRVAQWLGAQW